MGPSTTRPSTTSTTATSGRRKLSGSERKPLPGARRVGTVAARAQVEVTVIVRPRSPIPTSATVDVGRQPLRERRYLTRREYAAAYGADPVDLAAVAAFARGHGLEVQQASAARRSVALAGRADRMTAAFGTSLVRYRSPRGRYRGRTGPVHVPRALEPVIQAVLGLDDRPQAHVTSHILPRTALRARRAPRSPRGGSRSCTSFRGISTEAASGLP